MSASSRNLTLADIFCSPTAIAPGTAPPRACWPLRAKSAARRARGRRGPSAASVLARRAAGLACLAVAPARAALGVPLAPLTVLRLWWRHRGAALAVWLAATLATADGWLAVLADTTIGRDRAPDQVRAARLAALRSPPPGCSGTSSAPRTSFSRTSAATRRTKGGVERWGVGGAALTPPLQAVRVP